MSDTTLSQEKQSRTILEGEEAFNLWQSGMSKWNQWVAMNPDADVIFPRDMLQNIRPSAQITSFKGYCFPDGEISFEHVSFGPNIVSFENACFGNGNTSFEGATFREKAIFENVDFGEGPTYFDDVIFQNDVNFQSASFGEGEISFEKTRCSNGQCSFENTSFGTGNVFFEQFITEQIASFKNAKFGDGNVSFVSSRFSRGVSFEEASFGSGHVNFDYVFFGDGNTDFGGSTFGEGPISFNNAQFHKQMTFFDHTKFGDGVVSFRNTNFGDSDVSFSHSKFGEGYASFENAEFSEDICFEEASFLCDELSFNNARAGKGVFSFENASFTKGRFTFERIHFQNHVNFSDLKNTDQTQSLSFRHCTFDKTLDLSNNDIGCIIDLTNTKLSNQVSLEGLRCQFSSSSKHWYTSIADDSLDTERLRRLKEIAEDNKDHGKALVFHADEIRSKRGHEIKGAALWLDIAFDLTSRYGQSVGRPILGLVACLFFFFSVYSLYAGAMTQAWPTWDKPAALLVYSLAQMFQFIPSAKSAIASTEGVLFGETVLPSSIYFFTFLQSFLSLIFLFLVGLGLRNRFRI